MLLVSPAMLIIVLCTTNGEREEIVFPSFSEWIIKSWVHKVYFDVVDEFELVG